MAETLLIIILCAITVCLTAIIYTTEPLILDYPFNVITVDLGRTNGSALVDTYYLEDHLFSRHLQSDCEASTVQMIPQNDGVPPPSGLRMDAKGIALDSSMIDTSDYTPINFHLNIKCRGFRYSQIVQYRQRLVHPGPPIQVRAGVCKSLETCTHYQMRRVN